MMFCIYVINAIINAYLIGVFIEQFQAKNEKKQEKQNELDDANMTMSNLQVIPDTLKDRIRTFYLQSFQMRNLQNEFNELSTGLKASLQERLKFEIAESIITEAPAFVYFRLFMI